MDIELVIKIPEGIYKASQIINAKYEDVVQIPLEVMANGTPLPKGHGRLIDEDELKKIIQENDVLSMRGFNVRICDINNTPTIIEADTKSEDKE